MTSSEKPEVSVVIASIVGPPFIDDCVESLTRQRNAPDFEIIVVDCNGKETQERIALKYPWVRVIPQKSRKSVPELRLIGAEHARAEIVAILEEHCLASEDWVATTMEALSGSHVVVGGSVADHNYDRLRDWVTYFCEYNAYMPPVPAGLVDDLPGSNIAFRQATLRPHLNHLDRGFWEAFLFSRLQAEGTGLLSEPKMIVYHRGPFNYFYYLRQRYLFSRAYAGARRTVMPGSRRAIYVLASPLLPILLLGRITSRVWRKRRRLGKFLLCLPMLIPVTSIYVFGELIGYIAGPGDSLLHVE